MKKIKLVSTEYCPKCNNLMQRRKRVCSRIDTYWFSEWDYCVKCRHVQHYEKYKQNPTKVIEYFKENSKEDEQTTQTLF